MDGIRKYLRLLLAVGLAGWLAAAAMGQDACCSYCGSTANVRRTCRPVATTRPDEVTGWAALEEDIAVPKAGGLLSCNCGGWRGLGGGCCASGKCELCLAGGCRACCKVRPRNRLMKKTFIQEVPVVVWVVDYVCANCAAYGGVGHAQAAGHMPQFVEPGAGGMAPMQELPGPFEGPAAPPGGDRREPSAFDELLRSLHAALPGK